MDALDCPKPFPVPAPSQPRRLDTTAFFDVALPPVKSVGLVPLVLLSSIFPLSWLRLVSLSQMTALVISRRRGGIAGGLPGATQLHDLFGPVLLALLDPN